MFKRVKMTNECATEQTNNFLSPLADLKQLVNAKWFLGRQTANSMRELLARRAAGTYAVAENAETGLISIPTGNNVDDGDMERVDINDEASFTLYVSDGTRVVAYPLTITYAYVVNEIWQRNTGSIDSKLAEAPFRQVVHSTRRASMFL